MSDDLYYPFAEPPSLGGTLTVAPGIRWLRMGLPFALDHINLWLLEDGDGWTLVDCGIGLPEARDVWERVIEQELNGRPIRRIIVTHFHPDHIGQAAWLAERFGVDVHMTEGEWAVASESHGRSDAAAAEHLVALYRRHGLDAERADGLRGRGNSYRALVPDLPPPPRRLAEGDEIEIGADRWRVMIGRGHAPEHACLYCAERGLLIAGDQILPTISSNVSANGKEDEDPLGYFLDSCRRFGALPPTTRVLPSHGKVFEGLAARADALIAHHAAHIENLREACREPRTATDLLPVMFRRKLDLHTLMFGMGETIAHLHHMHKAGLLRRSEDEEGVLRYQSV